MTILKFECEIFYDANDTTNNFYKLLFDKISDNFNDYPLDVIISKKLLSNITYLKCDYKIPIRYSANDYIGINDVYIYPYDIENENDTELIGKLIIKYHRKEKLRRLSTIDYIRTHQITI